MTLNLRQIREIVRGAVRVEEENGLIFLRRFTKGQEAAYKNTGDEGLFRRTTSTAGIRLALRTDSQRLSFSFERFVATSRKTAYFDLYINRQMVDHVGFETQEPQSGNLSFALGAGEKDVELYFPWEACFAIKDVTLDDGACLRGLFRPRRLLAFGDSITQGVYSNHPSLSYACRLAGLLDAELANKGIGGDTVFPELLCESEPAGAPDLITVAYGTNDWGLRTKEEFLEKCRAFAQGLLRLYPNVPIVFITPVWRYDWDKQGVKMGIPACAVEDLIRKACQGIDAVRIISGWGLIPADTAYYYDGVHPNDEGFAAYAENLYAALLENKILNI